MKAFHRVDFLEESGGGHLLAVLPDITAEAMGLRWGEGTPLEEDGGYEVSWLFESSEGVGFEVYTRFGVVRVGGTCDPQAFIEYLRESLGMKEK